MSHSSLETWRSAIRVAYAKGAFPQEALQLVLSVLDRFEGTPEDLSATEVWTEAGRRAVRGLWSNEAGQLLVAAQRRLPK
jgi:hypothetical protein